MKIQELLTIAIAGLLAAGCQSVPKAQSESDPNIDLTRYKTFALLPLPERVAGGDPGLMLRIGNTLSSSVKEGLTAKGYREAELNAADFAVQVAGQIVPRVDVTDWGYSSIPGSWTRRYPYAVTAGYRDVTVDSYEEGTLSIEVYDSKLKKMVWTGWMKGRTSSKREDPARLRQGVTNILAQFPDAK